MGGCFGERSQPDANFATSDLAIGSYEIETGATITAVVTNANGNITSIPPANSTAAATFAYNNANRLASVTGSPMAATFVYDHAGQRYSKTDGGSPANIHSYDQNGTLIAENDGGTVTDYVYVDGRPIATIQPGATPAANQINYVLADHLGTPQLVSNSNGATAWQTAYQPFGTTGTVNASITQNLRFPGQYADPETGFSYNLNRDYMPNLARYLESDPIGLSGGVNPYIYTRANPLKHVDRRGLIDDMTPTELTPQEQAENLNTAGGLYMFGGGLISLIPGAEPIGGLVIAEGVCMKAKALSTNGDIRSLGADDAAQLALMGIEDNPWTVAGSYALSSSFEALMNISVQPDLPPTPDPPIAHPGKLGFYSSDY